MGKNGLRRTRKDGGRGPAPGYYFLLGQFMTEQFAQFSSSSFSRPEGIVSPHRQSQPEGILVCNT
jgi:hypothetical protein